MDYRYILYEVHDKVAWLTFNRPDQLNAMNAEMMREIIDALGEIRTADPQLVRIAVIKGSGKAFMAGADIKEYALQTPGQFRDFQQKGYSLYSAIEENPKPIIAAINGYAFGGGFEIALACDMLVAMEGAKMGLPEILLNLIPGGGGAMRLSKKIGVNRANEIIMTGRAVSAEEMHRHGLVNYIYPKEAFIENVTQFAKSLTDKEPGPLSAIKTITRLSTAGIAPVVQDFEYEALSNFYHSKEGQQKIQEFYKKSLEKRK